MSYFQTAYPQSRTVQFGLFDSESNVSTTSVLYEKMRPTWDLIHDLCGGTRAMRAAGPRWLPMEPKEQRLGYLARLNRSVLYNGYTDTLKSLRTKPFSKPVTIAPEDGLGDEQLEMIAEDVDMSGRDLTTFTAECYEYGLKYGVHHTLIDYPNTGGQVALDVQREQKIRPTFVHVTAPQLLGWKTQRLAGGTIELIQIRIHEKRVEDVGEYGDIEVDYIRVITKDAWELWRKDPYGDGKYVKHSSGNHTLGEVPLRTMYFKRTGHMTGDPTLEDLAWLNLLHWQSMSDQRNCLRLARFATLFMAGVTDEEMEGEVALGPTNFLRSANAAAKCEYVEHSGAALKSGEDDLQKLEKRMQVLGLRPYVESTADSTATGKAIDTEGSDCDIKTWIRLTENFMVECYRVAAKWIKKELPEDFAVEIYDQFEMGVRAIQDMTILVSMAQAGLLDKQTVLEEAKRRGMIAEGTDVEEILDRIEKQGPSLDELGLMGEQPFGEVEEGEEEEDEDEPPTGKGKPPFGKKKMPKGPKSKGAIQKGA